MKIVELTDKKQDAIDAVSKTLEEAKSWGADGVVVIGWITDGEILASNAGISSAEAVWMMEATKLELLTEYEAE